MGQRRWWQYNPEKFKANLGEARTFFGAARHGPRGMAMRPYHPDHYDPEPCPEPGYPEGPAGGDSRFCERCGHASSAFANFCGNCGGHL